MAYSRVPQKRESAIQTAVVHYARGLHFPGGVRVLAIKITTNGYYGSTSYPDYIFCLPDRAPLFIEFKAADGSLSDGQRARIDLMRTMGYMVQVCLTAEHGKWVIDQWVASKRFTT